MSLPTGVTRPRPKWQYRLLLCTVIILFVSLVLVLTVSVLYGFNMALPHIRVVKMRALWEGKGRDRAPNLPPWGKCSFAERTFQKNEMTDQHFFSLSPIPPDECPSRPPPPHVDSAGHIPIVSTILFSNPNSFFTTSSLSPIRIYALPSRSPESLLALTAPRTIRLAGHEEGYSFDVNFTLKDVGSIDGGNATVAAVLEGQNCLLYTTSTSKITVKGLGLIPTSRNFKVECTVLRKWGENPLTLSDCYGRFFKG
ncbi:hypothetical protein NSK_005437 [Nannochloropsis salina CCMP1776]|uniref:Late embryogenesis abundant protein LEA-2 subgroup domain-containing protein n=1 Tax=Nannochloropsis salina CCMP1776 TaxID=1027361 RepID=A0A4D9D189_9STRA|nr:hypothetical protein NSK_005437 [Nannochloropsis salina CCMP1776]|eukprot:TFJ83275.1 hypothetical protein NSK_005437 [Nannochloropsis salina CCMP1776]